MFKTIFKVLGGLIITLLMGSVAYISVTIPEGFSGFVTMASAVSGLNKSVNEVDQSDFTLPEGFEVNIVAKNLA